MSNKLGTLQVDALALGASLADAAYLGADQIYGGATAPTQYSIFASTAPVEPTSNTDADPGSWLAQQFYVPAGAGPNLSVKGIRIYVPTGSAFIGKTGSISLLRRDSASGGIYMSDDVVGKDPGTTEAVTPFTDALAQGWNERYFSTEWPMNPGDGIIVGYMVDNGAYYLYDNTLSSSAIEDHSSIGFYLAEAGNSTSSLAGRCVYKGGWTNAKWYGIDIIVREE